MTTDSSPSSQTSNQPAVPDTAAVATPVAAAPASAATAPVATKVDLAPVAAVPAVAAPVTPAVVAPVAPAPVVPDTQYVLKLPETGAYKGVELNTGVLPAMLPAFKAAQLTQTQLDAILPAFVDFQRAQPALMLAHDLEVTMKDPAVGGMNWGRTQGYVNDALSAFTSPEFRQKLERWGIANDLEFVRVFANVGKAMRGDEPARGQPSAAEPTTRAQRMYGKTAPQG